MADSKAAGKMLKTGGSALAPRRLERAGLVGAVEPGFALVPRDDRPVRTAQSLHPRVSGP
jgi:hypothetical protein